MYKSLIFFLFCFRQHFWLMKHCCRNHHRLTPPTPEKNWLYSALIVCIFLYQCSYWLACNSIKTNFEIWINKSTSVLTQSSLLDSRAYSSNWAKCFDLNPIICRHRNINVFLKGFWEPEDGLILVRTCCSVRQVVVVRLILTGLFI